MSDVDDEDRILPSVEEIADREEASRKKLIEDGAPFEQVPDGQIGSEDRSSGIMSEDEEMRTRKHQGSTEEDVQQTTR